MCAGMLAGLSLVLPESVSGADFPQGLMLHFNFDEAPSGGVISDRSGRGYDGRAIGAIWASAGKRGGGVAFASSNQCIVVTNYPVLNLTQVTYAVWFQTSASNTTDRAIIDKRCNQRCWVGVVGEPTDTGNKGRLRAVAGDQSTLSDNVVTDSAWHHAMVTFDGESLKLYIDGQLQKQSTTRIKEFASNVGELVIGMNKADSISAGEGRTFNGMIDDLMIFNHALTEAEAGAVIASLKAKFTRDQVARRLVELKGLLDRGLILQEFYDRKVKECEAGQ